MHRRSYVLKCRPDRLNIDRFVVFRELEAIRIGLDLRCIEAVGRIDEIVLDDIFDLEVAGDLADFASDIEEQLPAFHEMEAPFLALFHATGKDIGKLHHRFRGNGRRHLRGEAGELLHDDLRRSPWIVLAELKTSRPALEISGIEVLLRRILEIRPSDYKAVGRKL